MFIRPVINKFRFYQVAFERAKIHSNRSTKNSNKSPKYMGIVCPHTHISDIFSFENGFPSRDDNLLLNKNLWKKK